MKQQSSSQHGGSADPLEYISQYWDVLTRTQTKDSGSLIGLPYPYIVPSLGGESFQYDEQYYWDSYFIALGLVEDGRVELAEGMLENLLHLLERFSLIPNASRYYMLGRSQPPLLTSYIFLIYHKAQKSKQWLAEQMSRAEAEYKNVWMSEKHPTWHLAHQGLSRYYDINVLHDLAEAESGWDMTPRFERKALDYLPIDLNCMLYKYEEDFAEAAVICGDQTSANLWKNLADKRKVTINKLMWGKLRGFYFDYNYQDKTLGSVWSLASYCALWTGVASESQAKKLVDNLKKFEKKGGLTTTTNTLMYKQLFGSVKTQWAYPNGWAPLHYFVIEGLERYGYHNDAKRIAHKWVTTCSSWYKNHGEFLEKYHVVSPHKEPLEGVYPSQSGFGWTNGVYVHLVKKYS